jgi:hypothetical protein
MAHSSLRGFAETLVDKTVISADDVRHLRREILPDGISAHDDVEILLGLDARIAHADPAWGDWLVSAIVDFVVWGERPTGRVDEEAAIWLAALLHRSRAPSASARRIVDEIIRETGASDTDLDSFASEAGLQPLAA